MDTLKWKRARPLADMTLIRKFEGMANITFPADFTECVLNNNNGRPSLEVFNTAGGTRRVFNKLLNFEESAQVTIFNTYETLVSITGDHKLIPFANDPFGNYICFDFSDPILKIVFWNHETHKSDKICPTFSDFLDNLKALDPEK